ALCLHQVREDIVNARQVPPALGSQPLKNGRVEPYAHRHLSRHFTQSHHARQLRLSESWDLHEVDVRVVARALALRGAACRLSLLLSPTPADDIFGFHASQPDGPR